MFFNINDNELLNIYKKIWENISNLINIECHNEPVYGDNDKYIKAKIILYGDKINTNFQGKKRISKYQKRISPYKCLSLIMVDSVIRANKKYYPQILLEECKYEIKRTK